MTENEWLVCGDPNAMLTVHPLKSQVWVTSDRKLRLFAVACCARVRHLLRRAASREALKLAEQFAEGGCTTDDLLDHRGKAGKVVQKLKDTDRSRQTPPNRGAYQSPETIAAEAARDCLKIEAIEAAGFASFAAAVAWSLSQGGSGEDDEFFSQERRIQADLLRDVTGNPFRLATVDPAWLTSTVVGLAHSIYANQTFDGLPILADALEESGCANEDVLAHCREEKIHGRGCWLLDAVLGRE